MRDGGQEGHKRYLCVFLCVHFDMFSTKNVKNVKPSSLLVLAVCTCNWYCDSVCERKCGLNVLTWLACCAAPGSGGRVMQALECEVPMELWKWELSREMGIAPCWFVSCAMLFASIQHIHSSFIQSKCLRRICVPVVTLCDRKRLFSTCASVIVCGG